MRWHWGLFVHLYLGPAVVFAQDSQNTSGARHDIFDRPSPIPPSRQSPYRPPKPKSQVEDNFLRRPVSRPSTPPPTRAIAPKAPAPSSSMQSVSPPSTHQSSANNAEPRQVEASDITPLKSGSAHQIALRIDEHYKSNQLSQRRKQDPSGVDRCAQKGAGQSSFMDAISGAVRVGFEKKKIYSDASIDEWYGLPGRSRSQAVSLDSNPLCEVSEASWKHLLGADSKNSEATRKKVSSFVKAVNEARRQANEGDEAAREKVRELYEIFFGCLSYSESLSQPGESGELKAIYDGNYRSHIESDSALERAFAGKSRPNGVIFYEDRVGAYFQRLATLRRQEELSSELKDRLKEELDRKYQAWVGIGLYQFKPDPQGNVVPCIQQWNERFPECRVEQNVVGVTRYLASSGQTGNSHCGVQKILQSFNSQVNTMNSSGTDLSNRGPEGLKKAQDRCVSLVARAGVGKVYTHFGPLADSVGNNLSKLFTCVSSVMR